MCLSYGITQMVECAAICGPLVHTYIYVYIYVCINI